MKQLLKNWWHGGHYPVLLPHVTIVDGGVRTLDMPPGEHRPIPETLLAALKRCDGTRTLRTVCRETTARVGEVLRLREEGMLILWPEPVQAEVPKTRKSVLGVIVSPHLDDAALSLGGLMFANHRQPGPVLEAGTFAVLDVFTQTPWWRLPSSTDVAGVSARRHDEENLAMRLTQHARVDLGLTEALLRGHTLESAFVAEPTPRDVQVSADVENGIASAVKSWADLPGSRWYLPLGVGNHIDHRLVRDASIAGLRRAAVKERCILFYTEMPYLAKCNGDISPQLAALAELGIRNPRVMVDSRYRRWKRELLRVYWSQLTEGQIREVVEYRPPRGIDTSGMRRGGT